MQLLRFESRDRAQWSMLKELWSGQVREIEKQADTQRREGWVQYVHDSKTKPKKLYEWAKRTGIKVGAAGLNWGVPRPANGALGQN